MNTDSALASSLPIGVFDSGVGGLTVLRALRAQLPYERFIYLGDTARLPYGTKSSASIRRYSLQAAQLLVARGIKCLVVACNTASAVALDVLREHFAPLPVLGVVEPGAAAGSVASRSGVIAVIATESTVQGGAYQQALARLRPNVKVVAKACPLFVSLAEEGWTDGPIVQAVAHKYLDDLFHAPASPDTLVLGCTHFPVLIEALQSTVGPQVAIVDSAATTAVALQQVLREKDLQSSSTQSVEPQFLATDGSARFARVGSVFLGRAVRPDAVEIIDLGSAGAL